MNETKLLLEQILTAQVLSLSLQIASVQKHGGMDRQFSEYNKEAVKLIHHKQPEILALLRQIQNG